MIKTSRQLKDKVKNLTVGLSVREKSEKSQMLIRNYLMERLLERISVSNYRDNFILKGGMLVASITGLDARATKDIDATVNALTLEYENISSILNEVMQIDLGDNILYNLKSHADIMEDFQYPGLRLMIEAKFDSIDLVFQMDVSTDDVITPGAVEYAYHMMLEDRTIPLKTYNLETLLAEKMQTIAARGEANTRARDFYDIYMLIKLRDSDIHYETLKEAFTATSKKRGSSEQSDKIFEMLNRFESSAEGLALWENFKQSSYFAGDVSWAEVIDSVRSLAYKVISTDADLSEAENEELLPAMG